MAVPRGPSLTSPRLEALTPRHPLIPCEWSTASGGERDQPALRPGLLDPCIPASGDTAPLTGCILVTVPDLSVILELGP